jgi:hypothetical protein
MIELFDQTTIPDQLSADDFCNLKAPPMASIAQIFNFNASCSKALSYPILGALSAGYLPQKAEPLDTVLPVAG